MGSDRGISFWDKDDNRMLKTFQQMGRQIPCASFHIQGNLFAYAKSYYWSQGSMYYTSGLPNEEIFIHYTDPKEVKPKNRKK